MSCSRERLEEIKKAWGNVSSFIDSLIPGFPRLVAHLLRLWPLEVEWITTRPLDLSTSESDRLPDEEGLKLRQIPRGQFPRLKLRGLPVISLLNAVPYLRPGIIRRCKRSGCTMFLSGWDRRDYCSKKCHPKREYDPSRNPYQKVLQTAKRLAEPGQTVLIIRRTLVNMYGEKMVEECFNPNWSFLKAGRKSTRKKEAKHGTSRT